MPHRAARSAPLTVLPNEISPERMARAQAENGVGFISRRALAPGFPARRCEPDASEPDASELRLISDGVRAIPPQNLLIWDPGRVGWGENHVHFKVSSSLPLHRTARHLIFGLPIEVRRELASAGVVIATVADIHTHVRVPDSRLGCAGNRLDRLLDGW